MEIILLSKFNLDSAVDTAWQDWKTKQQTKEEVRQTAIAEVNNILSNQFQSEIDEIFEKALQEALNLKILPVKEVSIFSIVAYFEYLEVNFYLRRCPEDNVWEITYAANTITCPSDCLRKQLLIEIGKLKDALLPYQDDNE